ncbi:V4R domain-containing protein [Saccharicrinis fermentans]|uniref:V4R domain protein n=1 Tax=Saccharicrinis fermentans DSM 9555 = JCM 21142 TaxID=869213 RepID=W7Y1Q5_9BACT|nr:V4R domain-containing protein [Saccharicrinis fermentans]GAF01448.1 V4R domain protein [Saccharicrinis fermentans DSM 9555 = JCM 21142]
MEPISYSFKWSDLGDIELGRPNLGNSTSVVTYRLMQYSLRNVLEMELGKEATQHFFYKAGYIAGIEFCTHALDIKKEFYDFIADLQKALKELNSSILRIEKTDLENQQFTLVLSEDLDCSGLPITDATTCDFDEGLLAGIFKAYTGNEFSVTEVDCWSTGARVCRFEINIK